MELDKNIEVIKMYEEEGRKCYEILVDSKIKICTTQLIKEDEKESITISALLSDQRKVYLQYLAISKSEIAEMFSQNIFINLQGKYITEFDVSEFDLPANYILNASLNAMYSY